MRNNGNDLVVLIAMEIIKRILVIAAATAALVYLVGWSAEAFGVHSPLFAFLANWLVMAWGAITGQVLGILAAGWVLPATRF